MQGVAAHWLLQGLAKGSPLCVTGSLPFAAGACTATLSSFPSVPHYFQVYKAYHFIWSFQFHPNNTWQFWFYLGLNDQNFLGYFSWQHSLMHLLYISWKMKSHCCDPDSEGISKSKVVLSSYLVQSVTGMSFMLPLAC